MYQVRLNDVTNKSAVVRYTRLIDATYKWSLFFIIGFGMIMWVTIGLEIFLKTSDPETTIKFIAYILTGMLHFYVECYISQNLIDHSIGIHFYINSSQWYRLSHKSQKLIQLMIVRCRVPCQLTAGNLIIMSVRTFGQVVRTSISYFTLARTFQI